MSTKEIVIDNFNISYGQVKRKGKIIWCASIWEDPVDTYGDTAEEVLGKILLELHRPCGSFIVEKVTKCEQIIDLDDFYSRS